MMDKVFRTNTVLFVSRKGAKKQTEEPKEFSGDLYKSI